MPIWSRKPARTSRQSPKAFIHGEIRVVTIDMQELLAQTADVGTSANSTERGGLDDYLPVYAHLQRIAGKAEALACLSFRDRVINAIDGRLYQEAVNLRDYVIGSWHDLQRSLGLLLIYTESEEPVDSGGAQKARARFLTFWQLEGAQYESGKGNATDAFDETMTRYTAATGKKAGYAPGSRPAPDIKRSIRPVGSPMEFRDGQWRRLGGSAEWA